MLKDKYYLFRADGQRLILPNRLVVPTDVRVPVGEEGEVVGVEENHPPPSPGLATLSEAQEFVRGYAEIGSGLRQRQHVIGLSFRHGVPPQEASRAAILPSRARPAEPGQRRWERGEPPGPAGTVYTQNSPLQMVIKS